MLWKPAALHQLVQTITWQGSVYTFTRLTRNEYNEPTGEEADVATIKGIFHNGSSEHKMVTTADAARITSKNTPYIMTTYANALKIGIGDRVKVNNLLFTVTGKTNLGQEGIAGEISLEEVLQDGVQI